VITDASSLHQKQKLYTPSPLHTIQRSKKDRFQKNHQRLVFLKALRQWKKKKVKRKDDVEYEKYLHHREQLKYSKN
jgi:hypothetical protein